MNFLKNLRLSFQNKLQNFKNVYRTDRVLRLYKKKNYDKISKYLRSQTVYNSVLINDYHFIYFLLSEKNVPMIEKLMKLSYKDKILLDTENPHYLSPIYFAAINNLFEEVDLLKKYGGNIFISGKDGNNLLHISCFYGRKEALSFGIKQGINVNNQNENGDTPLHIAIIKENFDLINILLENNSLLNIKNKNLYYPIHEAVETGNLEIVKILEFNIEKIRSLHSEFDPIHIAAKLEKYEILKHLVKDNKLLINLEDTDQNAKPLHYACLGKSQACAKFLLDNGAMINSQDKFGNTALHIAVLNNDIELCQILQEYKPNLTLKNKDKLSPVDLIYSENNKSIFRFFSSIPECAHLFRIEN